MYLAQMRNRAFTVTITLILSAKNENSDHLAFRIKTENLKFRFFRFR